MADRGEAVLLKPGELAALIRATGPNGESVSLNWLTNGVALRDMPENDWAFRRIAELRGIDLEEPK